MKLTKTIISMLEWLRDAVIAIIVITILGIVIYAILNFMGFFPDGNNYDPFDSIYF